MAERKVTCRYCDADPDFGYPLPAGEVPLCERHARELSYRMAADLDRVAGQPVHYDRIEQPAAGKAADAGEGGKPDPQF